MLTPVLAGAVESKKRNILKDTTRVTLFTIFSSMLMLASITAEASTFSFIGGNSQDIPSDWNPSNAPVVDEKIIIFQGAGEGIWLNGPANLVYTYIGKEAGSTNASRTSLASDPFFKTDETTFGATFETSASSAGYLDFIFEGLGTCCVTKGTFTNGTGNSGDNMGLSLAVALINPLTSDPSPSTLYLMLGDGFGDTDYDDMVVKVEAFSAVPVPAAIWLFGTALIGFVGLSRRTSL